MRWIRICNQIGTKHLNVIATSSFLSTSFSDSFSISHLSQQFEKKNCLVSQQWDKPCKTEIKQGTFDTNILNSNERSQFMAWAYREEWHELVDNYQILLRLSIKSLPDFSSHWKNIVGRIFHNRSEFQSGVSGSGVIFRTSVLLNLIPGQKLESKFENGWLPEIEIQLLSAFSP